MNIEDRSIINIGLPKDFYHYLLSGIFIFAILVSIFVMEAYAGGMQDLRAWAGLELFPSLLSADLNIANKQGEDGKLLLVLMYNDRNESALDMATYLNKVEVIREIPIKVELAQIDYFLSSYKNRVIAGIFLTQRFRKNELEKIISFAKEQHVIIFSPFEGDVERGVHGGIDVSDRVLPYLNKNALQLSKIEIKPFFLKIAKLYE